MEQKKEGVITIGMFGTCGDSKWRDGFIEIFKNRGIEYFNPLVPDWKPEYATVEAQHLVEDEIIMFPVTDETYGCGSLAETGYSIISALRSNKQRFIVVYIAPDVNEQLKEANPALAKESFRSRKLVLAHLQEQMKTCPNLFVVNSIRQMQYVTLELYNAMEKIDNARRML